MVKGVKRWIWSAKKLGDFRHLRRTGYWRPIIKTKQKKCYTWHILHSQMFIGYTVWFVPLSTCFPWDNLMVSLPRAVL